MLRTRITSIPGTDVGSPLQCPPNSSPAAWASMIDSIAAQFIALEALGHPSSYGFRFMTLYTERVGSVCQVEAIDYCTSSTGSHQTAFAANTADIFNLLELWKPNPGAPKTKLFTKSANDWSAPV